MKTLILTRHAKSSWNQDVTDHERPLKTHGCTDAKLVADAFKAKNIPVQKLLSSTAVRAHETALIFMDVLGFNDANLELLDLLYDFSGKQVLEVLRSVSDDCDSLMLFGHNNAMTSLVNSLGSLEIDHVPTAGLVMIRFETDSWSKIESGITQLTIFPKDLRE